VPLSAADQRAAGPAVASHGDRFGVTDRHVLADRLRAFADSAAISFSSERDLSLPVTAIIYRPISGPAPAARRQAKC
jgi:hypothetical protein